MRSFMDQNVVKAASLPPTRRERSPPRDPSPDDENDDSGMTGHRQPPRRDGGIASHIEMTSNREIKPKRRSFAPETVPRETRRGVPGDPNDSHSWCIEAALDHMVIGSLYLANDNQPEARYKPRWF
ncbi:hypothetical protein CONLIGDRAFT_685926 [Coniochaeta ligniaria NRRL 30616]|uniref:Uncharacterized protein n=1 Tax=Coniochaeta ligniaria NRRL 30616 TaxID=1408157 RepID=A0A1J7J584_9PEZI|nr:hypothetical protein CONLIGDRAFT_685926 [Coniochaeta ligniaria NRRL 30616]